MSTHTTLHTLIRLKLRAARLTHNLCGDLLERFGRSKDRPRERALRDIIDRWVPIEGQGCPVGCDLSKLAAEDILLLLQLHLGANASAEQIVDELFWSKVSERRLASRTIAALTVVCIFLTMMIFVAWSLPR